MSKKLIVNFKKNLFEMSSEMVILIPFYNKPLNEPEHCIGNNNKGRLDDIYKYGKNYVEYGDIDKCDIVIIPYKWRGRDEVTLNIINEAYSYNKPIATFLNSDSDEDINISPASGYIFQTSLYRSNIKRIYKMYKNKQNLQDNYVLTFALPAFSPDTFNNYIMNSLYILQYLFNRYCYNINSVLH